MSRLSLVFLCYVLSSWPHFFLYYNKLTLNLLSVMNSRLFGPCCRQKLHFMSVFLIQSVCFCRGRTLARMPYAELRLFLATSNSSWERSWDVCNYSIFVLNPNETRLLGVRSRLLFPGKKKTKTMHENTSWLRVHEISTKIMVACSAEAIFSREVTVVFQHTVYCGTYHCQVGGVNSYRS